MHSADTAARSNRGLQQPAKDCSSAGAQSRGCLSVLVGPMQRHAGRCSLTWAASMLLRLMVGMLLLLRRCMSSSASPSALTLTLNKMWASCPAEYLQARIPACMQQMHASDLTILLRHRHAEKRNSNGFSPVMGQACCAKQCLAM